MASIDQNWIVLGAVLLVVLLVGWWLLQRGQTGARPRAHRPDVLDEGAAPAQRNQALIDAPPAAAIVPPPLAGAMAGVGEIVAVAAQDAVEELESAAPPPAPVPAADPSPVLPDESPTEPEPVHQIPAEPAEQHEPIAEPSAPPQPVAPVPAPAPAPAPASAGDDLSRIKGLGPKLQALLPQLGITTYAQIAALTDADLAELDGKLGAFAGRPKRDNWMEQASFLAAGDVAGFEARFGKL